MLMVSWKSLFFVVVFSWLRPYACHSGCFVDHSAGCGETTQGELFEVDADHNTLAGVPWLDWVTFWFRTFVSPLWEKRFLFLGYNSCWSFFLRCMYTKTWKLNIVSSKRSSWRHLLNFKVLKAHTKLVGGFKYSFFNVQPYLGKWSSLSLRIFFNWVGSTTNCW